MCSVKLFKCASSNTISMDTYKEFMIRGKKKRWNAQLKKAARTIENLIIFSRTNALIRPERARRHIRLARKIAMQYNIRIPPRLRFMFCKHCHMPLVFGKTARVRFHRNRQIIYCLQCKHFRRILLHTKSAPKQSD